MGIYTVLNEVKTTLDGLVAPHHNAATAWLKPIAGSTDAPPGTPQLFVVLLDDNEQRQAFPRQSVSRGIAAANAGLKKAEHQVGVYVQVFGDPSDEYAGQGFYQLLDAVIAKLRAIDVPITMTDPDTGFASELTLIGERFRVTPDAVRAVQAQRYVRYLARIETTVTETFNS